VAKIPGIGKSIALKIKELAGTGSLKYLEDLRAQFPEAILELFSIPGLGAKKIKALYERLHVSSIEQLQQACEAPTPTPTGTPRPTPTLRPLRKIFKNCKKCLDTLPHFLHKGRSIYV
jgi:DNA polymerase/3'-5' exonuclease PolX